MWFEHTCSQKQSLEKQKSFLSALPQGLNKTHNLQHRLPAGWKKEINCKREDRTQCVCVGIERGGKQARWGNAQSNTLLEWNIQICIRKRKRKNTQTCLFNDPLPTLNDIPPLLSLVFPSSSLFLSDFISWPFRQLVSCLQITLLPKGQSLRYHLPLFIPHSASCPHGDQSLSSVLSSQAPISSSFFSSFLPPKTRPMPQPSAVTPPKIEESSNKT